MFIATLVSADGLEDGDIAAAEDALAYSGCSPSERRWLEHGEACDIAFIGSVDRARESLESFHAFDIFVQPVANREKRLLIADMDSTMITVECIDELADYAGIKPEIAAITEAAMRGELDFEGALDARVALLKDLDEGVIERCLAERVRIMPGAKALVRTMRARGATAILVSGGFTRFAEPVAREIGFDRAVANVLEIADGRLTGTVTKPIVGSEAKERALVEAIAAQGLAPEETLAVGDGANDLQMIRRAGLGVAYHAKPIVAAAAAARIDNNDLSALLYAQGIPRREWITGE